MLTGTKQGGAVKVHLAPPVFVSVIAAEGYRSARDQGRLRVRNSEVAVGARVTHASTLGHKEDYEVVNARRPANVAQGG